MTTSLELQPAEQERGHAFSLALGKPGLEHQRLGRQPEIVCDIERVRRHDDVRRPRGQIDIDVAELQWMRTSDRTGAQQPTQQGQREPAASHPRASSRRTMIGSSSACDIRPG